MNDVNNLELYNRLREVPAEACKPITGGNLKGLTNITPQWRIEALTKEFGPCGIGWIFDPPAYRFEKTDAGEVICFCSTNLYVKIGEEWTRPIPGEGGNKFIAKTYNGLESNDECCKMALTDALSTAAKMLGLAADVYYREGRDSKYGNTGDGENGPELFGQPGPTQPAVPNQNPVAAINQPQYQAPAALQQSLQNRTPAQNFAPQPTPQPQRVCAGCGAPISDRIADFSLKKYGRYLCLDCQNAEQAAKQAAAPVVNAAPVNRNDALSQVFPFGKYANKTIAEVIAIDRKTIEYYAADSNARVRNQYPAFWMACNAALGKTC